MAQETGRLLFKKVDSGTSKAGKPWQKMTFVIETNDPKYPKKIAFDSFKGDVMELVQDTTDGTNLRVEYNVESREWNGKWFSNINAWSVEVVREEMKSDIGDHNGVNQANQMYGQEYTSPQTNNFQPQPDDLPF